MLSRSPPAHRHALEGPSGFICLSWKRMGGAVLTELKGISKMNNDTKHPLVAFFLLIHFQLNYIHFSDIDHYFKYLKKKKQSNKQIAAIVKIRENILPTEKYVRVTSDIKTLSLLRIVIPGQFMNKYENTLSDLRQQKSFRYLWRIGDFFLQFRSYICGALTENTHTLQINFSSTQFHGCCFFCRAVHPDVCWCA